jgi:antitoxin HicB
MIGYRIKLAPDDNGTVLVTCPALPEVTTFGKDEVDALRRAVGAIEEALAARMADGDDIPEGHQRRPNLVRLPALTVLKAELYRQLRETGITRNGDSMRKAAAKRSGLTPVRPYDPLLPSTGALSAIIGMVSAIDREHCPLSIGTAVRLHRNPQLRYVNY